MKRIWQSSDETNTVSARVSSRPRLALVFSAAPERQRGNLERRRRLLMGASRTRLTWLADRAIAFR